ncbi:MAG: hypothetical protein OEZ32_12320 [Nitrospinota bacterium]|nr:hypothetical protein [Nitrospinota bacterium]
MPSSETKPGVNFYAGLFMVTFATLALQIIQTRILSVVTWYYLAFFTISMAMFGLTAGAVWVYYHRAAFERGNISDHLSRYSSLFALSILLSFLVQTTLAITGFSSGSAVLVWAEMAIILASPYVFSGIVVSIALTMSPYPIGKVYGVDLIGAATGCIGAFLLLNITSAYAAIFLVGAVVAVGAILFSRHAGMLGAESTWAEGFIKQVTGKPMMILVLAVVMGMFNAVAPSGFEPILVKNKLANKERIVYSGWNSFSNVQLEYNGIVSPAMWGPSPVFFQSIWRVEQNMLKIDSDAGTAMYYFGGDKRGLEFLQYDITTLAHILPRKKEKAAVIGVGGGRDIQSAYYFGFDEITGVDVNPIFIKMHMRDDLFAKFSGIRDIKGVTLINDEARSWFRRTDSKFDMIQMSLVDTWASTGAGAFTLSENSLYTLEGWECFMNRLTPDGIFTVSRWFGKSSLNEAGRVLSLATAVMLERGVENPQNHIALVHQGRLITIIISARPFDKADMAALEAAVEKYQYQWIIAPGAPRPEGLLGMIISAKNLDYLNAFSQGQLMDLSPPTDDRPFFFNLLRMSNPFTVLNLARILGYSGQTPSGVISGNIIAGIALFNIFLISLFLTVITIVIPLRPAVQDSGRKLVNGATLYFACIGFGFITVEMGMLQKFSVFLGHPIYSLTVALFSLILSTGIGSLLSDRIKLDTLGKVATWSVMTAGYLVLFSVFGGKVLFLFDAASMVAKISVSVAMISAVGLLMGFGFPTGMSLVSKIDPRPTPWLWGVNGACGVLGSCIAIWTSISYSISATFLVAAVFYLSIIPSARMIINAKD